MAAQQLPPLPAAPGAVPSGDPAGAPGAPLTRAQREVVRLYQASWGVAQIAEKLGITPSTVYQHAYNARRRGADLAKKNLGAPHRKVDYFVFARMARLGKGGAEIAREAGVTHSTVCRGLRVLREAGAALPPPTRQGFRQRTIDYDRVAVLFREGLTYPAIAEAMGAPLSTIRNAIHSMRDGGVDLGWRHRSKRTPAAVVQPSEPAVSAPVIRCMCCRKSADILNPPRWFVCTDCKDRDGAPLSDRRAA